MDKLEVRPVGNGRRKTPNPPVNIKKECVYCSSPYLAVVKWQKFCSDRCSSLHHLYKRPYPEVRGSANVGTIHELTCSIDLFSKGYQVFRALSPSAPCDLVALKGSKCLRIQVRQGTVSENAGLHFYKSSVDEGKQEHFAVVVKEKVSYFPSLEEEYV